MDEQSYHGYQMCSGTNPRKCQDLGDSILLILGSFILINVGINVVTMLWRHVKIILRILFHYFYPKDKQHSGISSHPMCMHNSTDLKHLSSKVSSRFHQRPSCLFRHPNHLDSWIPDTDDEKASRCCWMPPLCGHTRAPMEAPWGLWKEGIMGAREALLDTALNTRANYLSRQETSSQFTTICKMDVVPFCFPQESKNKTPDYAMTQFQPHSPDHTSEHIAPQMQTCSPTHTYTSVHIPQHTPSHLSTAQPPQHSPSQAQTNSPTHPPQHSPSQAQTNSPAHPPQHSSSQAQTNSPAHPPQHSPSQAQTNSPVQPLHHSPSQAQTNTPVHLPQHSPSQAQTNTPVHPPQHSPSQAQTNSSAHPPQHNPSQVHGHENTSVHTQTSEYSRVYGPVPRLDHPHVTHNHVNTLVPAPPVTSSSTTIPVPPPTPVPVQISAPALVMTVTTTPAPNPIHANTSTSILTPFPSNVTILSQGLSTGHVVYDARKVEQNLLQVCSPQNSGYSRTDLGTLSRSQEEQGLVNSGTGDQPSRLCSRDKLSTESILDCQELGNTEWKISNSAEDKFLQPKTFPYCNFHPCSTERRNTESQPPVYTKFLVYSKDTTPSQPCFHCPTSTQNSQCTIPPPCTLSLPLVPPRSFVLQQPANHQKLSTLIQSSTFLPSSRSPQPSPSSQFPVPPQSSTILQHPAQPQPPEVHESLGLTQDSSLQRTLDSSKDSQISRNPGFSQDSNLHKNPNLAQDLGLHKTPDLSNNPSSSQDSGLHKNPYITQDSDPQKSQGTTQDASIFRSSSLTQPSGLHKNTLFPQTSDIQKSSSFMQDSGIYKTLEQNQEIAVKKNQDLTQTTDPCPSQDARGCKSTGNIQDPEVPKSVDLAQDSDPQKCPQLVPDSGIKNNSGISQESGLHKYSGFMKNSDHLQKGPGLTQDSGDYKSLGLVQDPDIHKNPSLTQATEVKRSHLAQDTGIHRSPEHAQDPNFYKDSGISQDPGLHKEGPVHIQDSGLSKTQGLTQKSDLHKNSCVIPNLDHQGNSGLALGSRSDQILGPPQSPKSTQSPKKTIATKEAPQKKDADQPASCISVPPSQEPCSSKNQVNCNDLQAFSEVPVLIELQPSSRRTGSQDWVYRPVDPVSSACQNYRQMSVPPKIHWKPHCPGLGTRVGHVVFDARQRQFGVGRDKCGALPPRHLHQEASSNSPETMEWGYQCVMRTLEKEKTKVHKE